MVLFYTHNKTRRKSKGSPSAIKFYQDCLGCFVSGVELHDEPTITTYTSGEAKWMSCRLEIIKGAIHARRLEDHNISIWWLQALGDTTLIEFERELS